MAKLLSDLRSQTKDNNGRFIVGYKATKEMREKLRISHLVLTSRECIGCKKTYQPADNSRKYCSFACYNLYRVGWNKGKKLGYVPKMAFKKGETAPNKGKRLLKITGKNHWNWQGGKTPEYIKLRNKPEARHWSLSVRKRDNFECQICGNIGLTMHANHIKKFSDYPDSRIDINNGITLCKNCHLTMVNQHEKEWESYFKFNLMTRFMGAIYE